ncbi:MAG: DUF4393 domain-containing protein [Paludibacter sp.]|nr:DUF4393 domain-containing protein [Paludibacter sp.]
MGNKEEKEDNIKGTVEAITGLVKAVPIYDDALQPAAKEIGKSLSIITKTINLALAPIGALVWGYEKIQDFIVCRVSEKLSALPVDRIVTPDPAIVCPSLEALRYTGNNVDLRELFSNLIASSMDIDKLKFAHPSFVEIIKNMSSDEAKIIKFLNKSDRQALIDIKFKKQDFEGEFDYLRNISLIPQRSGIDNVDLCSTYLDNLCRLGLIDIPSGRYLINEALYEEIKSLSIVTGTQLGLERANAKIIFDKKHTMLTDYGKQFCKACLFD